VTTPDPARALPVTFFANVRGAALTAKAVPIWDLRDLVLTTSAATKTALPLLAMAVFGDKRTDKNCLRHDANVTAISGVTADYDAEKVSLDAAIKKLRKNRLAALVYTSASHSTAKPHWRVIAPFSAELPPSEHTKLTARLNGVLGGVVADESFTLSQSYHYGYVDGSAAHFCEYIGGDFIDLRPDLDARAIGKSDKRKAAASGNGKVPAHIRAATGCGRGLSDDRHDTTGGELLDVDAAVNAIRSGRNRRVALRGLAAHFVAIGDPPEAVEAKLRELMQQSPRDARRDELIEEIPELVSSAAAKYGEPAIEGTPPPEKVTLAEVRAVFLKWFGEQYDTDTIDATLAAAASERLGGDPLWLLIISGPGNAKTETVQALAGAGAYVTSTIASEGALLSGTPKRQQNKLSTGGLLRKIGARGVLVIKDVTSILSADRNARASVLAAIREVYDGRWERNVGTDGGRTLTWTGRIVLVGAVTTAWDSAHTVVAAMGDRFVLIRSDSGVGRKASGTRAIGNTGNEVVMREELAAAVGGIIAHASLEEYQLGVEETEQLVAAADIVTMARTSVERDYQGEIIDAHAPEMPTRFAKQLAQIIRGSVAIGMTPKQGMRLAIRCARDSIPPLRREILIDVAANPGTNPNNVRKRVARPWRTVKREMEALFMLRLLQCDEEEGAKIDGEKAKTKYRYYLAQGFDRPTLLAMGRVGATINRQKCE
jgi:hypothetical protein